MQQALLEEYEEIQKPQAQDNQMVLSGSRDELSGFHMHTKYPEFLNKRDLNQIKELFTSHQRDPG